jgi:hypothetical protein
MEEPEVNWRLEGVIAKGCGRDVGQRETSGEQRTAFICPERVLSQRIQPKPRSNQQEQTAPDEKELLLSEGQTGSESVRRRLYRFTAS